MIFLTSTLTIVLISVAVFLFVILLLVAMLLYARFKLTPQGDVQLKVNDKEFTVSPGSTLLNTLSANEISVEQEKKLGSVLLTVNEDNRNTDDILGSILFTGVSDGLELGTTLSSDITILKSDYFTALDDKLEVVSIYPNPVKDYLKIEVEELILSSVEVFNIHGSPSFTFNITRSSLSYKI